MWDISNLLFSHPNEQNEVHHAPKTTVHAARPPSGGSEVVFFTSTACSSLGSSDVVGESDGGAVAG